jgi:hypothetical protein
MSILSLDYGALLGSFDRQAAPQDVGAACANAAAARYYAKLERTCALLEFNQAGAKYWFDFASFSRSTSGGQNGRGVGADSQGHPWSRLFIPARLSHDS